MTEQIMTAIICVTTTLILGSIYLDIKKTSDKQKQKIARVQALADSVKLKNTKDYEVEFEAVNCTEFSSKVLVGNRLVTRTVELQRLYSDFGDAREHCWTAKVRVDDSAPEDGTTVHSGCILFQSGFCRKKLAESWAVLQTQNALDCADKVKSLYDVQEESVGS